MKLVCKARLEKAQAAKEIRLIDFARAIVNYLGLRGAKLTQAVNDRRYVGVFYANTKDPKIQLTIYLAGSEMYSYISPEDVAQKVSLTLPTDQIENLTKVDWNPYGNDYSQAILDAMTIPEFAKLYEEVQQKAKEDKNSKLEKLKPAANLINKAKKLLEELGVIEIKVEDMDDWGVIEIHGPNEYPAPQEKIKVGIKDGKPEVLGYVTSSNLELENDKAKISAAFPSATFEVRQWNRIFSTIRFKAN